MNKFLTLVHEYRGTHVLKGSAILFFLYFWLTKALSFLQHRTRFLNNLVHSLVQHLPHSEFQIRNTTGIFLVRPFDDSTTICSDYFEAHLRSWLQRPPQKDLLLDIGANRGLYTVLALNSYGYREVHAFEPNSDVFNTLKKNIGLNGLQDRVGAHSFGLGDSISTMGFTVDEMHKGGGRVAQRDTDASFTVSIKPLDTVLSKTLASRTNFVKIDTEGYEFAVLAGATQTLALMPLGSCIMVESAEPARIAQILAPYGFEKDASVAFDHLFIKSAL